ncbi:MAG: 16S rRNA (guanine(527)-N(7))-methyltransferase RsmG [Deltaproteobacteria bacterium]|nr:16S rRNA (guanine(527)-N(7))-methyltransferase RsmG [Deltaproteobacteria bacterium]
MPLGDAEEAALREGASALGVALDAVALARLGLFLDELDRWRERVNLVSVRSRLEIVDRHVVDSLAAVPVLLAEGSGIRVADLGSGAGFPGVPIAIAAVGLRVTLVEPRRKRANFLRAVLRRLDRPGLGVVESRIEDLAPPRTAPFDAVTTRATFPVEELPGVAGPLVRTGGLVVAFTRDGEPVAGAADSGFESAVAYRYRLADETGAFQLTSWRRRG